MSDAFRTCPACHGWPDHRSDCELDGCPDPEEDGRYDAQKLMDFVKTRNIARAEALIAAYGTDAIAMMRFPWS